MGGESGGLKKFTACCTVSAQRCLGRLGFTAMGVQIPAPGSLIRALHWFRRQPPRLLSTLASDRQGKLGTRLKVAEPLNPMIQIAELQEVYA
jgi:hypothetical protein